MWTLRKWIKKRRAKIEAVINKICFYSIRKALSEKGFNDLINTLRKIVPDISEQESRHRMMDPYLELKMRGLHAFQCSLMLRTINSFPSSRVTIVDLGDSSGTHMLYIRGIKNDSIAIDSISVNLDPIAIEKIRARKLRGVLCRAEELDLRNESIDLIVSFEMIEHLHNPALLFRRLSTNSGFNKIIITVPYVKKSRVGLHHVRNRSERIIFAEDEHIFELSPEDWSLLLLHSGWKVTYNEIYYQYPHKWPLLSWFFAFFWKRVDYQGFWGATLEKDLTYSNRYSSWAE